MSFISKGKSVAVIEESSYGASNPTFTNDDYLDFTSAEVTTDIAKIERNVTRNSMLKLESVLGQETSSGSIGVEISAAVAGVLNGDKLYKNGIGKELVESTATTATGGTVSIIEVTSTAGINIGQVLRVNLSTGDEFVQVKAISGLNVEVTPDLSVAPTAGDAVQGVLTYVLPKPVETVASLAVRENLKPTTGTPVDYDYLGVMVTEVSLEYPVANIATASFSIGGATFVVNSNGSTPVVPCELLTPVIGKNAGVKIGNTNYVAQDLKVSIGTEVTDINAITADGISNKIAVAKTVTGSFKVEYTGVDNFTKFKEGTKGALTLLLKDGGKTSPVIHGVLAPQIKFTKVTRSEDGMVIYDNIEFEVLSPSCDSTERALSVFFA
jgi:hypothetical protein